MKRFRGWWQALSIALIFGGCATVDHGNYDLSIRSSDGAKIEMTGSLNLSAFVAWRDTQYGHPPISLIKQVILLELGKIGLSDVTVQDVKWTRYENSNEVGFSATVVVGNIGATLILREMRGQFRVERKARSK